MSNAGVFLSGLFFGGAIDHAILALSGRTDTPYGVEVGIVGNWAMALIDVALAIALWNAHWLITRIRNVSAERH